MAACPFGTIHAEVIPYLTSICDYCVDRANGRKPVCVTSCPFGALDYKEGVEEPEKNIFQVGENLLVHVTGWRKDQE